MTVLSFYRSIISLLWIVSGAVLGAVFLLFLIGFLGADALRSLVKGKS